MAPQASPSRGRKPNPSHETGGVGTRNTASKDSDMEVFLKNVRGTGRVFPVKFTAHPASTPEDLFQPAQHNRMPGCVRLVHRNDPTILLLYVAGCRLLGNDQDGPKAGWAFAFEPASTSPPLRDLTKDDGRIHWLPVDWYHYVTIPSERAEWKNIRCGSGRVEAKGPFGDAGAQTSERAELRAVIAALRFRVWGDEGFGKVVIASHSVYVVEGATTWVRQWIRDGWKIGANEPVRDQDMWQVLMGDIEKYSDRGVKVEFWLISGEGNYAKGEDLKAAVEKSVPEQWFDATGVSFWEL